MLRHYEAADSCHAGPGKTYGRLPSRPRPIRLWPTEGFDTFFFCASSIRRRAHFARGRVRRIFHMPSVRFAFLRMLGFTPLSSSPRNALLLFFSIFALYNTAHTLRCFTYAYCHFFYARRYYRN